MSVGASEFPGLSVTPEMELARATAASGVDLQAVETSLLYIRAAGATLTLFDRVFRRHGVSIGKFNMLLTIAAFSLPNAGHAFPKPAQIAHRLGVRRPTVTGLLDNLEKDGLVERSPHATDGRALRVELTKKGRRLLDKLLPEYWALTESMAGSLSHAERKGLLRGVEKVYELLPALLGDDVEH